MASDDNKTRAQKLVYEAAQEYLKAKTEQEQRQWAETHLPLLDEAIALDRENDGAWNVRGVAKRELGDHQGAVDDHTKAIALNPKNDAAWSNRGFAKHQLGDYDGAIADHTKTIDINPNNDAA